jgi:hypothetical protein
MIQHAIATLFGITALTPTKWAWVAITLANICMMFRLGWLKPEGYFLIMAASSLVQGGPWWNGFLEVTLTGWTSVFVWRMLPKDKHGRIFALSIGLVVTCVLIYACPPPWPHYDPAMYHTRLFSTAAFLGISLGSAVMTRNPSTMLCVPWFMAVLIAGSQRGFDRWMVGIYTNLIWSFCLICWLAISRRDLLASSSMPDAPAAHPRYPQSLS